MIMMVGTGVMMEDMMVGMVEGEDMEDAEVVEVGLEADEEVEVSEVTGGDVVIRVVWHGVMAFGRNRGRNINVRYTRQELLYKLI